MIPIVSLAIAVGLAIIHIVAAKLRFLDRTPRSVWLSGAGGVSVAYVFVHVLPDLASAQQRFREVDAGWLAGVELHIWLLALLGLTAFYGLERFVKQHHGRGGPDDQEGLSRGVFWIHTGSFAVYNLLFGYLLLHREKPGLASLVVYGIAIGLHFLVTDYALQAEHKEDYQRIVKWTLAGSLLAGWFLGMAVDLSELGTSALFAVLAGGIVLNVMKEELPEERKSRFSAFAAGVAGYAAILLAS